MPLLERTARREAFIFRPFLRPHAPVLPTGLATPEGELAGRRRSDRQRGDASSLDEVGPFETQRTQICADFADYGVGLRGQLRIMVCFDQDRWRRRPQTRPPEFWTYQSRSRDAPKTDPVICDLCVNPCPLRQARSPSSRASALWRWRSSNGALVQSDIHVPVANLLPLDASSSYRA